MDDDLRQRTDDALRAAMRARDKDAIAALRVVRAAFANAEAVDADEQTSAVSGPIAGASVGLGAAEVARRDVPADELVAIVQHEVDELVEAAADLERGGRADRADELRRRAAVVRRLLEPPVASG